MTDMKAVNKVVLDLFPAPALGACTDYDYQIVTALEQLNRMKINSRPSSPRIAPSPQPPRLAMSPSKAQTEKIQSLRDELRRSQSSAVETGAADSSAVVSDMLLNIVQNTFKVIREQRHFEMLPPVDSALPNAAEWGSESVYGAFVVLKCLAALTPEYKSVVASVLNGASLGHSIQRTAYRIALEDTLHDLGSCYAAARSAWPASIFRPLYRPTNNPRPPTISALARSTHNSTFPSSETTGSIGFAAEAECFPHQPLGPTAPVAFSPLLFFRAAQQYPRLHVILSVQFHVNTICDLSGITIPAGESCQAIVFLDTQRPPLITFQRLKLPRQHTNNNSGQQKPIVGDDNYNNRNEHYTRNNEDPRLPRLSPLNSPEYVGPKAPRRFSIVGLDMHDANVESEQTLSLMSNQSMATSDATIGEAVDENDDTLNSLDFALNRHAPHLGSIINDPMECDHQTQIGTRQNSVSSTTTSKENDFTDGYIDSLPCSPYNNADEPTEEMGDGYIESLPPSPYNEDQHNEDQHNEDQQENDQPEENLGEVCDGYVESLPASPFNEDVTEYPYENPDGEQTCDDFVQSLPSSPVNEESFSPYTGVGQFVFPPSTP